MPHTKTPEGERMSARSPRGYAPSFKRMQVFFLSLVSSPLWFLLNPSPVKASCGIGGRDGC